MFLKQCTAGSVVEFGKYYDQNNVSKEPLKWLVTAVCDGRAQLISEKAVDCRKYHESYTGVTWKECSLRRWLNDDFFRACFEPDEQIRILTTNLPNNAGENTDDKIFLLSVDEVKTIFKDRFERQCRASGYAISNGAALNCYGYCSWWLRSRGCYEFYAGRIDGDGTILGDGHYVDFGSCSVRPVLWLNTELQAPS